MAWPLPRSRLAKPAPLSLARSVLLFQAQLPEASRQAKRRRAAPGDCGEEASFCFPPRPSLFGEAVVGAAAAAGAFAAGSCAAAELGAFVSGAPDFLFGFSGFPPRPSGFTVAGAWLVAAGASDFGVSAAGFAADDGGADFASPAGSLVFALSGLPRPFSFSCFSAAGEAAGVGSCASAAPASASEPLISNVVNFIISMWIGR